MSQTENMCFNCFAERTEGQICPYCGYSHVRDARPFPMALPAGSLLNGQFIIGRVLGQGGFGITYLAFDKHLRLKVAIKEYLPEGMAMRVPESTQVAAYSGEKEANFLYGSERFLDEARVLAKFAGSRNIANVRTYFVENNTSYFVMDFIEGVSFKTYLDHCGGRIPWRRALEILVPVLDALAPVHQEGFIHRDVTPDNIYITFDNEIKLLDFGSARYSLGNKSKSLDVILKAGYAPKEQYMRRGKQGPYTDVYSVAACFYAAVTGTLPPEALERMEKDEIVPLRESGCGLPSGLEAAVMRGLAVRQEDRWQTAEEFREALLAAAGMTDTPRMEVPAVEREAVSAPPTKSLTTPIPSEKRLNWDGPTLPAVPVEPRVYANVTNEPTFAAPPEIPVSAPAKRRWLLPVLACALVLATGVCWLWPKEEPAVLPTAQTEISGEELYQVEYRYPCKYDYVEVFIDGYARCQQDGKWGYLGLDGNFIVEPLYDSIGYYFDDYVLFRQNGKYGYLDRTGAVKIPASYSNALNFDGGMAAVGTADGWYFYIDKEGRELFEGKRFRYAGAFHGEYAPVLTDEGATLLRRDGTLAERFYDKTRDLADGLAAVQVGDKWGYADAEMNLVIPPLFLTAGDFSGGLATVEDEEGMFHIDKTGKQVDVQKWDKTFDFSDGYATVFQDGYYGYMDPGGNLAIPPRFEDVWSFQEGLCPVKQDNRWFYIDKNGNTVLDDGWREAYIFSEGFAKVKKGNFYGMIDREGNLVLPYEFDDLLFPADGLVPVKRSNRWGYYHVERMEPAPEEAGAAE